MDRVNDTSVLKRTDRRGENVHVARVPAREEKR